MSGEELSAALRVRTQVAWRCEKEGGGIGESCCGGGARSLPIREVTVDREAVC